jgi:hypothetical protein
MRDLEVWRVVPSLPAILVSSHGRVMTAPYKAEMPYGGSRQYGGMPTIGVWNPRQRRLHIVHKGRTYKVARLVAEAFHGSQPFEGAVVMHLDENPRNNRPENLSWGTQKENLNAPGFIAYCKSRTGENSPTIKALRSRREAAA